MACAFIIKRSKESHKYGEVLRALTLDTSAEQKYSAKLKEVEWGYELRLNQELMELKFRMQSVIEKSVKKNQTESLCRTLASIPEQKASSRLLFQ